MSAPASGITSLSIVIPVHNEAAILDAHVREIVRELESRALPAWEVLLVENGSRDNTREIATRLATADPRVKVVALDAANYGLALQAGMLAATGEVICNFDIDYWDVEFLEIAALVMRVKYDIVIGSKTMLQSRDHRGPLRRVVSFGFRILLFTVFDLRVSETHGIKAWRNTPAMRSLFSTSEPTPHTFDTEVILRAARLGHAILEIPVEIRETRATKRHILQRIPAAARDLARLFVRLRQAPR